MQKKQTPINMITFENMPQAISRIYEEIFFLRDQLIELKEKFEPKAPTEYLTRKETAELLKVDLSTLHNWKHNGTLIPKGLGDRVYYIRSVIDAAMISLGESKTNKNN